MPAARSRLALFAAAVAIELTHLATLYHDDVMDEAAVRRGGDSANSRWGNTVAILTGDYLFARASALLADLGTDAIRIQAETFGHRLAVRTGAPEQFQRLALRRGGEREETQVRLPAARLHHLIEAVFKIGLLAVVRLDPQDRF